MRYEDQIADEALMTILNALEAAVRRTEMVPSFKHADVQQERRKYLADAETITAFQPFGVR